MNQGSRDRSLDLPRILCLHGGGTNARIFRAQCRSLVTRLKSDFRLVFAEAPLDSDAGPDVAQVYGRWGPFKSWLRWRPDLQPCQDVPHIAHLIEAACDEAMNRDTLLHGASGEWVGLLGFSQGAKVAASLLYRQQLRNESDEMAEFSLHGSFSSSMAWSVDCDACSYSSDSDNDGTSGFTTLKSPLDPLNGFVIGQTRFRFGILLAGRGPFVSLDPSLQTIFTEKSQLTTTNDIRERYLQRLCEDPHQTLSIPTVHMHGLRDPGIRLHRQLYDDLCDPCNRFLIEWDGDHRVPVREKDVLPLVERIRLLAKRTRS